MAPILQALPALVVLSIVVWRVSMLRGDPGSRALWITLAFLGVGLAFYFPPLYFFLDRATGSATTAAVGELLCTLGSAAAVRTSCKILSGTTQRWARADWAVSAGTGVAVTALLNVFPPAANPMLASTTFFYDDTWRSVIFNVAFSVTLATALGASVMMWWRFGRLAPPGTARTGLALVAAGGTVGFVYVGVKVATLLAWQLGAADHWWAEFNWWGETVSVLVCGALLAWGTSWEAICGRVALTREWLWAFRSERELRPLWQLLVSMYPDTALGDSGVYRDRRFSLLRMVVEIRDGFLALSEDLDPMLTTSLTAVIGTAECGGSDVEAVLMAVLLRIAPRTSSERASGPVDLPSGGGDDLATEVAWLRAVSNEYRGRRCQELLEELTGHTSADLTSA